jgi:hypothetical protein
MTCFKCNNEAHPEDLWPSLELPNISVCVSCRDKEEDDALHESLQKEDYDTQEEC